MLNFIATLNCKRYRVRFALLLSRTRNYTKNYRYNLYESRIVSIAWTVKQHLEFTFGKTVVRATKFMQIICNLNILAHRWNSICQPLLDASTFSGEHLSLEWYVTRSCDWGRFYELNLSTQMKRREAKRKRRRRRNKSTQQKSNNHVKKLSVMILTMASISLPYATKQYEKKNYFNWNYQRFLFSSNGNLIDHRELMKQAYSLMNLVAILKQKRFTFWHKFQFTKCKPSRNLESKKQTPLRLPSDELMILIR